MYNYILMSAIVSWISAQVIKTLLYLVFKRKFRAERLFGAGGMPSAHSAMVCSAVIAVERTCGFASPEFALMLIFALIVMYDAMGVRRAAGIHAKEINRMNSALFSLADFFAPDTDSPPEKMNFNELKEYLGHTPFEVLGGAILGVVIAFILPV
jgi:acid phosphatase family membrane protein YuiD